MYCKLKDDYYMDYERKMIFKVAECENGNYRIEEFWVLKQNVFLILYYMERYGDLDDAAAKIIEILGKRNNEKEIRQFLDAVLEKYKEFFNFSEYCLNYNRKEISEEILNLISDFQVINEERQKYDIPKNVMIQITEKCSNYSDECHTNRLCVSGCREMKWELLKKIQTECSENNIGTMVLCGGESLEYPYIAELIERNNQLGIDTVLYTSLLTETENFKKIFQNKIKELNLIICKDKIDEKSVFWNNLQVVFSSVSSVNIHCGSERDIDIISRLLEKDIYCNKLNKIYYYYKNIRELDKAKSLYSFVKTKKIEWLNESACTEKSKFVHKPCSKSGKLNMSIDVNGMVVFCLLNHNKKHQTFLGDIKSESLSDIWERIDSSKIYNYYKKCISKN